MCNCITELEAKMKEKLSGPGDFGKMKPKVGQLKHLLVTHMALMMPSMKSVLQIPFTATWTIQSGREKETTINVTASHCPFCGTKFEEEAKA